MRQHMRKVSDESMVGQQETTEDTAYSTGTSGGSKHETDEKHEEVIKIGRAREQRGSQRQGGDAPSPTSPKNTNEGQIV